MTDLPTAILKILTDYSIHNSELSDKPIYFGDKPAIVETLKQNKQSPLEKILRDLFDGPKTLEASETGITPQSSGNEDSLNLYITNKINQDSLKSAFNCLSATFSSIQYVGGFIDQKDVETIVNEFNSSDKTINAISKAYSSILVSLKNKNTINKEDIEDILISSSTPPKRNKSVTGQFNPHSDIHFVDVIKLDNNIRKTLEDKYGAYNLYSPGRTPEFSNSSPKKKNAFLKFLDGLCNFLEEFTLAFATLQQYQQSMQTAVDAAPSTEGDSGLDKTPPNTSRAEFYDKASLIKDAKEYNSAALKISTFLREEGLIGYTLHSKIERTANNGLDVIIEYSKIAEYYESVLNLIHSKEKIPAGDIDLILKGLECANNNKVKDYNNTLMDSAIVNKARHYQNRLILGALLLRGYIHSDKYEHYKTILKQ